MKIICEVCHNEFDAWGKRKLTAKFCSIKCKAEYQHLHIHEENHPRWTNAERVKTCQYCGKEFKQGKTEAISSFSARKFCSNTCGWIGQTYFSGENHANWTGGRRQRNYRHVRWADSVIRRDKATCRKCGATGIEMQAHHLRSYIDHPELRYDINNGMTLCCVCHWNEHGTSSGTMPFDDAPVPETSGITAPTKKRAYRRWEGKCDWCGEFLSIQLSKAKDKIHHFCNKKCMGEYNSLHKANIVISKNKQWEGKCDYCGTQLSMQLSKAARTARHFCDRKCFGKYYSLHNSGVKQPDKQWEGKCDFCGAVLTRPLNKAKRTAHHFCSRKCFGKYNSGIAGNR